MIEPEKVIRARVAREVGTALSLFLSGRFRPRLMMYGGLVRLALVRIGRNDDGLAEVFTEASFFGQACEARFLGSTLPDPAKYAPGSAVALSRAVSGSDLWRPVVQTLTASLQLTGLLTTTQIAAVAEIGNTGGKPATGERLRKQKEFHL